MYLYCLFEKPKEESVYMMPIVEVFKTNVKDREQARNLIDHIHNTFIEYKANFDLEDCDKILRVACTTGDIQPALLINLLNEFGFTAEVLPDDPPVQQD